MINHDKSMEKSCFGMLSTPVPEQLLAHLIAIERPFWHRSGARNGRGHDAAQGIAPVHAGQQPEQHALAAQADGRRHLGRRSSSRLRDLQPGARGLGQYFSGLSSMPDNL